MAGITQRFSTDATAPKKPTFAFIAGLARSEPYFSRASFIIAADSAATFCGSLRASSSAARAFASSMRPAPTS